MMNTKETEVRVNIMDMQIQAPVTMGYFQLRYLLTKWCSSWGVYILPEMRKHLYECFNQGYIIRFPLLKLRQRGMKTNNIYTLSVYCDFRMLECSNKDMVERSE